MARELNGGDADAAGRAMDQHAFARLQVGQMFEGVIDSEEDGRHGGRRFERPALRHGGHGVCTRDDVAGETRGTKAHDGIAR